MSVDGMWSLHTDAVGRPNFFLAGGVVTLLAGRVFGGDGALAYAGTFSSDGDAVSAAVRIWTWNRGRPDLDNVFGLPWPLDVRIELEGERVDRRIECRLRLAGLDAPALRARLDRIADIP